MDNYQAGSHCRYFVKYHIVWIVKRRRELLISDPLVKRIVELLREIGKSWDIDVEEVGSDRNHLHIFCSTHQDIKPSKVVQVLKGNSSRILQREFPNLKQETYGAGLWGVGYYIATVGHHANEEAIKIYIKRQGMKQNSVDYRQLSLM